MRSNKEESSSSSSSSDVGDGASIPNLTISLVKSIVGAGVFGIPAAVAFLGDTIPQALPTATILILLTGAMNAYFFSLLGCVCAWTGATSYRDAWDQTVGPSSSKAVAITVTLKTLLSCLAYSIILADSFQSLAVAAGLVGTTRTTALLAVTVSALLPLCMLKDLRRLAPFSFAGVLAIVFTAGMMVKRSLDGSYSAGSALFNDLPASLQPAFGDQIDWIPNAQGIVLLCTLATAFVAHYNAPRFYRELSNNTLPRFNRVVYTSFLIAAAVFGIVAITGFGTWGTHAQSLILNNYSGNDPLAATSRLALAASIVFTYPLPFVGLRDGVLDVWNIPETKRGAKINVIVSVALLSVITYLAVIIQDLGLVLSVGGGTFSTAVAAIFPALMFRSAVRNKARKGKLVSRQDETASRIGLVFMVISTIIGVTGVSIALTK
jgi:amino acid permease